MTGKAADAVYEGVYAAIRNGELLPGAVLVEDALAQQYGVSRTPVREALLRLTHDGLAERVAHRFTVRKLTAEQVRDVYPIIAVLEGLGARCAAKNVSVEGLQRLESFHDEMLFDAKNDDAEGLYRANRKFHSVILESSGNITLVDEVYRFRAITERFRSIVLSFPERRAKSFRDHETLMAALRDGDAEKAEVTMRDHVTSAERLLVSILNARSYLDVR